MQITFLRGKFGTQPNDVFTNIFDGIQTRLEIVWRNDTVHRKRFELFHCKNLIAVLSKVIVISDAQEAQEANGDPFWK